MNIRKNNFNSRSKMEKLPKSILFVAGITSLLVFILVVGAAPTDTNQASKTCKMEIENANRTLSKWAETMEGMVNESSLPKNIRGTIHGEANKILDMIEDFGQEMKKKQPPQLAKDLVSIRRLSNRMALEIYLNTFDMRWPQTSLSIGVTVERVQQACLDRETINSFESPAYPLQPLV